ncbi:exosortase-associated EpsI family protein (plasmid) [Tundrisphaera sp. TA3]|uniref:exosortase-associated EpsI family protein n=1 Tax=Tundrisphaera sp. TA3 TaxID=3435775 RepID=UPI003EB7F3BA
MALACVLIGTAGWLRTRQDRQLGIERSTFQPCPFQLEDIPQQLGSWKNEPSLARQLDDKTVQITGSTDHLVRTYVDDLTGVRLSLLVLYGPAEPVIPHTPEVCYPATGFSPDGAALQREIPYGDKFAVFQAAIYSRPGTLVSVRERAYHSFRLDGRWSPDVGRGIKFHRSNPGLFKVQIQRGMSQGEKPDKNEPIEAFLAMLIPDLERRIAEGDPSEASAASPIAKTNPGAARASSATSRTDAADDRAIPEKATR